MGLTNQMPFEPWFQAAFDDRTVHKLTTNNPKVQTLIDEAKSIEKIKNRVDYAAAKDAFLLKIRMLDMKHMRDIWGDWKADY